MQLGCFSRSLHIDRDGEIVGVVSLPHVMDAKTNLIVFHMIRMRRIVRALYHTMIVKGRIIRVHHMMIVTKRTTTYEVGQT